MSSPVATLPSTTEPDADRKPFRRRFGLLAALTLLAVCLLLIAKVIFRGPDSNSLLFAYGIAVTSVAACQIFVALVLYRDSSWLPRLHVDSRTDQPTLFVSAMVAVHNEQAVIEDCLRSMTAQTYPLTEVLVIDDASTDGTAEVLERLAGELPIRVISLPVNVGKKKALAAGMLESMGDVFAFTDSDSTWAPDAVERCVAVLDNDPRIGAVSGHCRAMNAETNLLTRMQDSWYEGQFSIRKAFESYFGAVTCVSGPLAVFRREAIFNYIPAWQGDRFLGNEFRFATDRMMTGFVLMPEKRARRVRSQCEGTPFENPAYAHRDWRIEYCKSARSLTVVPDTFQRVAKQQIRWKKSFLRNLFFTGSFYWRRQLLPSVVYYLHILFVLAGPIIAFRHMIYLPFHGSIQSMALYVTGILLMGSIFGLAFRVEDPAHEHLAWYRPVMSIVSTLVLTWLLAYSILTIKKMTWSRE